MSKWLVSYRYRLASLGGGVVETDAFAIFDNEPLTSLAKLFDTVNRTDLPTTPMSVTRIYSINKISENVNLEDLDGLMRRPS